MGHKRKEHRLGVCEENLVTRHLKLKPADPQTVAELVAEIDQLFGMDEVSFDEQSHMLEFAYDATRLSIERIEEILSRHGVEINQGWWNRFKEDYYRFNDDNIKENANHEPWSCHKQFLDK
ncbi:MAG: cation transporter [Pseudohongiellaceae bacterium]